MFKSFFESPETEVARLAQAPIGSDTHALAALPVNIEAWPEDLIIELPRLHGNEHTVVVVPFKYSKDTDEAATPHRRHTGWWSCLVVASNHPSYPVGGHRISVSAAQLVRGTQRTIEIGD